MLRWSVDFEMAAWSVLYIGFTLREARCNHAEILMPTYRDAQP